MLFGQNYLFTNKLFSVSLNHFLFCPTLVSWAESPVLYHVKVVGFHFIVEFAITSQVIFNTHTCRLCNSHQVVLLHLLIYLNCVTLVCHFHSSFVFFVLYFCLFPELVWWFLVAFFYGFCNNLIITVQNMFLWFSILFFCLRKSLNPSHSY